MSRRRRQTKGRTSFLSPTGVLELSNVVYKLERLIAERDALVAERHAIIAEWDASGKKPPELEQLASNPEDRSARLERQLNDLYNSRSWRITAPLRKIMTWLRLTRLF